MRDKAPAIPESRKLGLSRPLAFVVVAATLFAFLMGSNVPTPLYDVYRREWHLTPFATSAVFAAYPLALVLVLWSCARISDRFGRQPIIFGALIASALGSTFFLLATSPGWLFAGRVAQAISVGLASGAGGAALVELEPDGNRRRAALVATLMFSAGGACAPLMSGLLAQYAPYPLALPYVVHLGVLLPLLVLALFLPETAPRLLGTAWLPRFPQLPVGTMAAFAIVSLTSGASWMVVGLFYSLVPSYLRVELGTHSLALAGVVPFTMLAISTVAQVALRGRDRALLITAYVLLSIGICAVVLAVPFHAVWLVFVGAVIAGAGHGYGVLGSQSAITRIAPAETRGEVFSLFYAVVFFSVGIAVLGVGALASGFGFFTAFLAFAGVVTVLCGSLGVSLAFERSL